MIIKCPDCPKYFDDEFRDTVCPHNTFLANDGRNKFKHYPDSWLDNYEPRVVTNKPHPLAIKLGMQVSEHDAYEQWRSENGIKTT